MTAFRPCGSSCLRLYNFCRYLRDLLLNRDSELNSVFGDRTILIASVAVTNKKDIKNGGLTYSEPAWTDNP